MHSVFFFYAVSVSHSALCELLVEAGGSWFMRLYPSILYWGSPAFSFCAGYKSVDNILCDVYVWYGHIFIWICSLVCFYSWLALRSNFVIRISSDYGKTYVCMLVATFLFQTYFCGGKDVFLWWKKNRKGGKQLHGLSFNYCFSFRHQN